MVPKYLNNMSLAPFHGSLFLRFLYVYHNLSRTYARKLSIFHLTCVYNLLYIKKILSTLLNLFSRSYLFCKLTIFYCMLTTRNCRRQFIVSQNILKRPLCLPVQCHRCVTHSLYGDVLMLPYSAYSRYQRRVAKHPECFNCQSSTQASNLRIKVGEYLDQLVSISVLIGLIKQQNWRPIRERTWGPKKSAGEQ